MLETLASVVAILTAAFGAAKWLGKRFGKRAPWRGVRSSVRRAYRLHRLRRGKYVARVTMGEWKAVLEAPGIEALHPRVREEFERGMREAGERAREYWIPRELTRGWLDRHR